MLTTVETAHYQCGITQAICTRVFAKLMQINTWAMECSGWKEQLMKAKESWQFRHAPVIIVIYGGMKGIGEPLTATAHPTKKNNQKG